MTPSEWLDTEVIVCVGTGGVGKTTVAAAMGLEAARRGRCVLVLTIDPARRLADALGTGPLDHDIRFVPDEVLGPRARAGGRLAAMMLDTKRTFDELVQRYAPDPETLEQILTNPIYRNLTDALSGSREYSAMERLYQLHDEHEFDLIVLDTPPASHALEFLEAPRRLTGFLDSTLLKLLVHPAAVVGRTGFRLFRRGSDLVLRTIERVTGLEFLRNVSEFLLAFESLLDGFTTRAHQVEALLRSPACGFVLVAGPNSDQARRAGEFWHRLEEERIRLVGLIVNRVRPWPGGAPPDEPDEATRERAGAWLGEQLGDAAAGRAVLEAVLRHAALARRDAGIARHLERELPLDAASVRRIPLMPEDVHAIDGLTALAEHVFGAEPARVA